MWFDNLDKFPLHEPTEKYPDIDPLVGDLGLWEFQLDCFLDVISRKVSVAFFDYVANHAGERMNDCVRRRFREGIN